VKPIAKLNQPFTDLCDARGPLYLPMHNKHRSRMRFRSSYKYERLETELFFGWYRRTPGGIHSENCANFHFVVFGEKIIEIWPPNTFKSKRFSKKKWRETILSEHPRFLRGFSCQVQMGRLSCGRLGIGMWDILRCQAGESTSPCTD
jgi:hypothetical protein